MSNHLFRAVYTLKILPRWVIIALDLAIIAFSTALGYLLRFNFNLAEILTDNFVYGVTLNVASSFAAIILTKSYRGIVRYTGLQDSVRIFYTLLLNLIFISTLNLYCSYHGQTQSGRWSQNDTLL